MAIVELRVEAILLVTLCLLVHGVMTLSVNSALAEIQKLKEVKDMLGKVENMINSFRGGKQSRTYNDEEDGKVVDEQKPGGRRETVDSRSSSRIIKDDGDDERSPQYHEVDVGSRHHQRETADRDVDDLFARQLKDLAAVLRDEVNTLEQCVAVDGLCRQDHVHDVDAGSSLQCCRGLRCSPAHGTCQLDCVSVAQSCRHNWFCCDGRRCTPRNGDFVCQ